MLVRSSRYNLDSMRCRCQNTALRPAGTMQTLPLEDLAPLPIVDRSLLIAALAATAANFRLARLSSGRGPRRRTSRAIGCRSLPAPAAVYPFPAEEAEKCGLDVSTCSFVELVAPEACSKALKYALQHPLPPQSSNSYRLRPLVSATTEHRVSLDLGLGWHSTSWVGEPLWILCLGDDEAFESRRLILFVRGRGRGEHLVSFCEELLNGSQDGVCFRTFRPEVEAGSCSNEIRWAEYRGGACTGLQSMFLPHKIKEDLLQDLRDFCNADACEVYKHHGMAYTRSYLFYGSAGLGKRSLANAVAKEIGLSLYRLRPAVVALTQQDLEKAIECVPNRSIVLVESVSSLSTIVREEPQTRQVTCAGLLSAIDDAADRGLIFILTADTDDGLDAAMLNSSVDTCIHFGQIQAEQVGEMFRDFFPLEAQTEQGMAEHFAHVVCDLMQGKCLRPRALKDYLLRHSRRGSAAEALSGVASWVATLNLDALSTSGDATDLSPQLQPKVTPETEEPMPESREPKFWLQELVDAAIEEQEQREFAEGRAKQREWKDMDPQEAAQKGADRLGIDFDPLAHP